MLLLCLCLLLPVFVFGDFVTNEKRIVLGDGTHETTEVPLYDSYHYTGIDVHEYQFQKERARAWLMSQMNKDYGWGYETQRAIIALHLSNDRIVNESSEDELLMGKQLHIELSLALARNETNEMSLCDLSLYINALRASCSNPRNFYGFDLVSILRERVDVSHRKSYFVTPLVYLTLCLNNASIHDDVMKLHEVFSKKILADKTDIQALASLASTCVANLPGNPYRQSSAWIDRLLRKTYVDLTENVYELALIVQALNAARVDPSRWDREEAISNLLKRQKNDGSFGDILATYYILPILSNKSLLSLSDHCSESEENGLTPIEVLVHTEKKRIYVNYALYYGDPVELTQTMLLKVSEGVNFFDIMRLAQEKNPNFRFSLDETKDNPSVYSIGGTSNDAEKGMYWVPYVFKNHNTQVTNSSILEPYKQSLKDFVPKFGDRFVFWMKPINNV